MFEFKIYSPCKGNIIDISQVKDPVFSEKMLGDGFAIEVSNDAQFILAPCDGVISILQENKHAVAITSMEGVELLIHVGIDTVNLEGKGFEALTAVNKQVKKGDKLLKVDFDYISKNSPSTDVIVVITSTPDKCYLIKNSGTVEANEQCLVISDETPEEYLKKKI